MAKEKRHDNYKYDLKYEASAEQKHRRALRNKARRAALRAGKVHKGDNKDVHHIEGINGPVRIISRHHNRSVQ
jgi:hypothetical protein